MLSLYSVNTLPSEKFRYLLHTFHELLHSLLVIKICEWSFHGLFHWLNFQSCRSGVMYILHHLQMAQCTTDLLIQVTSLSCPRGSIEIVSLDVIES